LHDDQQGGRNDKKAKGGKRTPKGTSIDPGEDINLATIHNQVTFKITPHDFAQNTTSFRAVYFEKIIRFLAIPMHASTDSHKLSAKVS
jgi:hypothetical protein